MTSRFVLDRVVMSLNWLKPKDKKVNAMKQSRRSFWHCGRLLVVTSFVLFCVASAQGSEPLLEGEGEIGLRNLPQRSLQIDGATYFLSDKSVILDQDGKELTLADLDVPEEGAPPRLYLMMSGRFSATEVGSRHVIQRLELIETPR